MPELVALIPAHNDAYTLRLCLASIVDHFDRIIVLDDCSTDETPDVVLDAAAGRRNVRLVRHEGHQLGWIEARNRLLAETDADHLVWIDADDVMVETGADGHLRALADGGAVVARFPLTELWGDLNHTTQRLHHHDKCHCYVNRRLDRDFVWRGGSAAKPSNARRAVSAPGPCFFHLKGVKPDRRLVERQFIRKWFRAGKPTRTVAEFGALDRRGPEELHRRALNMLLHSRQDKIQGTYLRGHEPRWVMHNPKARPPRPNIIKRERPGRFRITYRGDRPVDRTDLPVRSTQTGREAT